MLFNSYGFLIFFPLVCTVFFIIPKRFQYIWLLFASYFFYACWNAKYTLLLMLWGYFLKLVIADRAALFVDAVYSDYENFGGGTAYVF